MQFGLPLTQSRPRCGPDTQEFEDIAAQRRAAKREEEETLRRVDRPSRPLVAGAEGQAPEKVEDWEAELRRLLGQPTAPRESTPPKPRAYSPPPSMSSPAPAARPVAPLPRRSPPLPPPPPLPVLIGEEEGPDLKLPPLVESRTALDHASSLNEEVAERLHRISGGLGRMAESSAALDEATQLAQATHRNMEAGIARSGQVSLAHSSRPLTPQAVALFDLLQSRKGAQQAILTALVLGPPKGLETPQ